jgi:hypothetical protein
MSVFRKRNLLIAVASLLVIAGACVAIWGVPKLMRRSPPTGQVTTYLLDDRGEVNGLLLASGDQRRFSPQTGVIVADQIKIGDQVTATGHAGTKTSYGREVKIEKLSANGRTIIEAEAGPPHPHGPKDKPGPRDRKAPEDRKDGEDRDEPANNACLTNEPQQPVRGPNNTAANEPNTDAVAKASPLPAPVPAPAAELFKAAGTIGTHLVNGHGDVDGIILSGAEQMRFSPKVGQLILAAEQGANTQVSVEGEGVRNERGIVIRPTRITVGNQTIALKR